MRGLQGDAARLPFSDETFDAVVMIEVMEHLPDPSAAAAEIARVLQSGETLLGSAPFVWPVHGDPHGHFRFSADGRQVILHSSLRSRSCRSATRWAQLGY
jgi:SAM-dependent methyltransferase